MQNRGVTLDESILEAIRETRRNLGQARHLPGFLYTAPEIFDYEVETIFMKEWLCVGRVEEFENEGDYRAPADSPGASRYTPGIGKQGGR